MEEKLYIKVNSRDVTVTGDAAEILLQALLRQGVPVDNIKVEISEEYFGEGKQ